MQITNKSLNTLAQILWAEYCEIFPALVKFDCPNIVLNARLRTTAGRCFLAENKIDMAICFLTEKNKHTMISTILQHEMAQEIDYNLFADEGHGPAWKMTMVKIGQDPKRCHNMEK